MVQRAQAMLTNDLEYNIRMDLINTILAITEGKVFIKGVCFICIDFWKFEFLVRFSTILVIHYFICFIINFFFVLILIVLDFLSTILVIIIIYFICSQSHLLFLIVAIMIYCFPFFYDRFFILFLNCSHTHCFRFIFVLELYYTWPR